MKILSAILHCLLPLRIPIATDVLFFLFQAEMFSTELTNTIFPTSEEFLKLFRCCQASGGIELLVVAEALDFCFADIGLNFSIDPGWISENLESLTEMGIVLPCKYQMGSASTEEVARQVEVEVAQRKSGVVITSQATRYPESIVISPKKVREIEDLSAEIRLKQVHRVIDLVVGRDHINNDEMVNFQSRDVRIGINFANANSLLDMPSAGWISYTLICCLLIGLLTFTYRLLWEDDNNGERN